MRYDPRIHNRNHLIKSFFGSIGFTHTADSELLVLCYHGTPVKYMDNFRKQLDFLEKHYNFISPTEFRRLLAEPKPASAAKKMLITFDDGIANNLLAAEELSKRNITGLFFLVPGFINSYFEGETHYFRKYIRPELNPLLFATEDDVRPMNWSEIKSLMAKHEIGSHTMTHTLLHSDSADKVAKEVVASKEVISEFAHYSPDSFCSINNTLESIGSDAKQLIKEHYKYHFTTFPGNNFENPNPYLIKRINIESHWMDGAMKWALAEKDWRRYQEVLKSYSDL